MSTPSLYRGVPPRPRLGYIKAHVVNPGRTNPTTMGQLCAGKVHNSPPPPSVRQQDTEQSQCSVILLWGTKNCQQSTRAGFCYSQRSVSSARNLVAVHVIRVSVCSGSSPNWHSHISRQLYLQRPSQNTIFLNFNTNCMTLYHITFP